MTRMKGGRKLNGLNTSLCKVQQKLFALLQVDVIVNSISQDFSTNSSIASGGAAAALVSAAGPNLVQELRQKNSSKTIPFGTVLVTKGHNLNCAEVFHGALLPWYSKGSGTTNQPDIVSIYLISLFGAFDESYICINAN